MDEQVDYFKILEEKLAQRSWTVIGFLLALFVFVVMTTLYALVLSSSLFDIIFNILYLVFLGQFLLLLLRVIRTKKGKKS